MYEKSVTEARPLLRGQESVSPVGVPAAVTTSSRCVLMSAYGVLPCVIPVFLALTLQSSYHRQAHCKRKPNPEGLDSVPKATQPTAGFEPWQFKSRSLGSEEWLAAY